jgi:ankyrin repeat protein
VFSFFVNYIFSVNKKIVKDGATPIIRAAKNGHIEVLKALLSAGAYVDEGNKV